MISYDEKKLNEIAKKHELRLVLLYGSQAKGTAREDSDIDIAVLGETPISFDILIELNNDFMDLFRFNNVDVKSLHNTNPLFRYEVTSVSKLLYGSEYDYASFRAYAFRDYMDSQSLLRLKEKLIKKRLESLRSKF